MQNQESPNWIICPNCGTLNSNSISPSDLERYEGNTPVLVRRNGQPQRGKPRKCKVCGKPLPASK